MLLKERKVTKVLLGEARKCSFWLPLLFLQSKSYTKHSLDFESPKKVYNKIKFYRRMNKLLFCLSYQSILMFSPTWKQKKWSIRTKVCETNPNLVVWSIPNQIIQELRCLATKSEIRLELVQTRQNQPASKGFSSWTYSSNRTPLPCLIDLSSSSLLYPLWNPSHHPLSDPISPNPSTSPPS